MELTQTEKEVLKCAVQLIQNAVDDFHNPYTPFAQKNNLAMGFFERFNNTPSTADKALNLIKGVVEDAGN